MIKMGKGFYKKEESGNWVYAANRVHARDYILDENNRESIDGWSWCEEAPTDYLVWLDSEKIEIQE